jgi:putative transposase
MARLPRVRIPGIAQHIIQRGNNRQACFTDDRHCLIYLDWLAAYANQSGLLVHAYVLMTNHVHILATPDNEDSVPDTIFLWQEVVLRRSSVTEQKRNCYLTPL